jgi:hypothetical protein
METTRLIATPAASTRTAALETAARKERELFVLLLHERRAEKSRRSHSRGKETGGGEGEQYEEKATAKRHQDTSRIT